MAVLTIEELRNFIRDKPELNTLVEKETDDPGLVTAIEDAIDDYNNTLPLIRKSTIDNFPSKSLLKIGAAVWVLKSAGMMMSRNHLTYSDGGISIEKDEKTQLYQSWLDRFEPEWERRKVSLKTVINLQNCRGGV